MVTHVLIASFITLLFIFPLEGGIRGGLLSNDYLFPIHNIDALLGIANLLTVYVVNVLGRIFARNRINGGRYSYTECRIFASMAHGICRSCADFVELPVGSCFSAASRNWDADQFAVFERLEVHAVEDEEQVAVIECLNTQRMAISS